MDKRGEVSSGQLAMIILAVSGFAIAALFLFGIFGNKDLTERDICRLSILSRATAPDVAQQAIPLSCFTEKVCITVEDGSILGFGGKDNSCKQFAGEKNIRTVEVNVKTFADRENAVKIIEKEVANAMFDCWYMTGQGKLDAFKGTTSGTISTLTSGILSLLDSNLDQVIRDIKPQCIVCSRVALSDELLNKDKEFEFLVGADVNRYMKDNFVPGTSLTYLQTFTDKSINSYAGIDKIDTSDDGNKYAKTSLASSQIAILFMQIKTEGKPTEIAEQAAILSATVIGGGGLLTGIGRQIIKTFPFVSTIVAVAGTGAAYLTAENIALNNQAVSFTACNEYEKTPEKSKLGCSLVKPIAWSAEEVNRICTGGIEGNL